MTIKYFNEEDGNYYDVTGSTGSSLVIGASGFQVVAAQKKYVVAMTQDGTNDPTIDQTYFNNIGNIVWSRIDVGDYRGVLNGAFTGNIPKIEQTFGMYDANQIKFLTIWKVDNNTIGLKTWDYIGENLVDDQLKETTIEFTIY